MNIKKVITEMFDTRSEYQNKNNVIKEEYLNELMLYKNPEVIFLFYDYIYFDIDKCITAMNKCDTSLEYDRLYYLALLNKIKNDNLEWILI